MIQWIYDNFINPEKVGPAWFVWAGGSITVMWLFVWWTLNLLPVDAFGMGFARAEQVNRLEVRAIQSDIIDTQVRRCNAATEQAKGYYSKRLQEMRKDYYKLTGQTFDIPTCKDLGVAVQ